MSIASTLLVVAVVLVALYVLAALILPERFE
jgi:phage shock protein PspC (stress-responsive transcriptional regulator)